jgi:hypothetical protein
MKRARKWEARSDVSQFFDAMGLRRGGMIGLGFETRDWLLALF